MVIIGRLVRGWVRGWLVEAEETSTDWSFCKRKQTLLDRLMELSTSTVQEFSQLFFLNRKINLERQLQPHLWQFVILLYAHEE